MVAENSTADISGNKSCRNPYNIQLVSSPRHHHPPPSPPSPPSSGLTGCQTSLAAGTTPSPNPTSYPTPLGKVSVLYRPTAYGSNHPRVIHLVYTVINLSSDNSLAQAFCDIYWDNPAEPTSIPNPMINLPMTIYEMENGTPRRR